MCFSCLILWVVFFLTIHFKHFDFIEWFDLNFNCSNFFERSSTSDFLVDFLMCLHTLFISLKILKFPASGLILINAQSSSFFSAFCFSISLPRFLQHVLIHQLQLQVCAYASKYQSCSLKHCIEFAYFLLQMHH